MNNFKIVSGGQPGITRGALDAALGMNISYGGWCSQRNLDANELVEKYPHIEVESSEDRESIRKNVLESDASAIIYYRVLEGCAEETLDDCVQQGKPYRLIDADETQPGQAAKMLGEFIRDCGASSLNVVGPESLDSPKAYKYGQDTTRLLIESLRRKGGGKRGNAKRSRQSDVSKTNGTSRLSQGKSGSRRRNRKKPRSRHSDMPAMAGNANSSSSASNAGSVEVIVQHKVPKLNTTGKEDGS